MRSYWWADKKEHIILLVIASVSLYLLLANLGNQYLWQDEAQTALVSKTVLTDGLPRGYDGKNFFSQQAGAEYGKNYIWRWHTWLPFYVVAGFYEVFGVSTFVSRLPFTLFGFGTVLLIYFFARSLWPNTRVPAIAAALLAISVPFLLLCRQCRYYSMVMFFSLLSLHVYVALLQRKKFAAISLFVASTLLFHSQHLYVVVFFASAFLHSVIFHRDRLKILLAVMAITLLVNGPWLIWLAGMKYTQPFLKLQHWMMPYLIIRKFLADLVHYVFPLWLLVAALIVVCANRIRRGRFFSSFSQSLEKVSLPAFFIIFNLVTFTVTGPSPFFRYIAPSIPLVILLIAIIIDAALDMHWLFALAAVVMLVATSQLKDYLYEITHDYDGPNEGIIRYLNKYGSPDDVVATSSDDLTLKFYTKMRVVGGLTGENLKPAKNARWVIIRKNILEQSKPVVDYLLANIEWNRYRPIEINYPDICFENRESPDEHLFRTSATEEKVVIYERIN